MIEYANPISLTDRFRLNKKNVAFRTNEIDATLGRPQDLSDGLGLPQA